MRNFAKLCLSVTMLFAASLTLTNCGFEQVDTGHRGITVRFGEVVGEPLGEGLHFYNPFTTDIKEYRVQQETWQDKTSIFTRDTQRVDVEFAVTYYADPTYVGSLYKEFGYEEQLADKVIRPVALGSIKDAIGQVIADELVGKREIITNQARLQVIEALKVRHVIVTDLQFTNLDFDDEYEKAVEQKVKATQEAQQAKNETVKFEERAKQTVMAAKAQAESMRIQSEALSQNRGLVEYELAKKWDGVLPTMMLGNSTPMINMGSLTGGKK